MHVYIEWGQVNALSHNTSRINKTDVMPLQAHAFDLPLRSAPTHGMAWWPSLFEHGHSLLTRTGDSTHV